MKTMMLMILNIDDTRHVLIHNTQNNMKLISNN